MFKNDSSFGDPGYKKYKGTKILVIKSYSSILFICRTANADVMNKKSKKKRKRKRSESETIGQSSNNELHNGGSKKVISKKKKKKSKPGKMKVNVD